MSKIVYDIELMKFMSLFETVTRSKVKDVFNLDDKLVFIVQPGEIGKAVGKKAVNVKKLENMIKKKVRIIEFSPNLLTFIRNIIHPLKVKDMKEEDNIVIITSPDTQTRGLLIGKAASNLRNFETIAKRFFNDLKEIKVI